MVKTTKSLMLKDIQELSKDIEIKKQGDVFLLEVSKNQKLTFLELDSSLNFLLKVKKGVRVDLAFVLKNENISLSVKADLEDDSFVRITCFSNKKAQTKYESVCHKNARFEAINLALSSLNSDSKINLKQNSSCLISNRYYNDGVESKINDLVIHEANDAKSLIAAKGYLLNAKSDCKGLIKINPNAFNSQGFQESQVLLEGDSRAISVPDLKILNNEVKCSHGSTISRIKDKDLFYFESRGIKKEDARKILIKGRLLSLIPDNEELKNFAETFVERNLK